MKNDPSIFIKCKTCGKYISQEDVFKGLYCSVSCSKKFTQCRNCGKYFIGESEYCSSECSSDNEKNQSD